MRSNWSRRTGLAVAMATVVGLAAAAPAMAQGKPAAGDEKPMSQAEKKKAAKDAYGEAKTKFEAGDYAGAVPLYEKADSLVPGAVPKFKVAESYDKLGDAAKAVEAYENFLASNPDPKKHDARISAAKTRIEELKAMPASVNVAVDPADAPNLAITVDGEAQTGTELSLAPGKHTITASADGFEPATQEFEVTYGEKTQINLTLNQSEDAGAAAPPPEEPPPPPPPAEERSMIPAYVTLGLAGAGAVVGTIFGIQALGSKSDYEDNPTQDLFDETERNALISDMSFGVALTFGVTGVVLLLSGDDSGAQTGKAQPTKQAGKPELVPFVGPNGGGAVGTIHF